MGTQIRPRPSVAMKLIASGVTISAAIARSPSFSRSSSSTMMTMRPALISSTASSTRDAGIAPLRSYLVSDNRVSANRSTYFATMSGSRFTAFPTLADAMFVLSLV